MGQNTAIIEWPVGPSPNLKNRKGRLKPVSRFSDDLKAFHELSIRQYAVPVRTIVQDSPSDRQNSD